MIDRVCEKGELDIVHDIASPVPATGVVPESSPELERVSPTADRLLAPEVTDQVYGVPAPPIAARRRGALLTGRERGAERSRTLPSESTTCW